MRILYLCKRHYMGHDVIVDRYARLYEQPYQLAQLGNDVLGVCLSYRPCIEKDEIHITKNGSMRWIGYSSVTSRINILGYPYKVLKVAKEFKPDIIVGASDCPHVILAQWVARKLGITFATDLYDDYETFGLAKIPFIKHFYRKALGRAKIISCVSQSLTEHIKNNYAQNSTVISLPSTINQSLFHPGNKISSRAIFQLPERVKIIGTAGGLTKEKGIDTVYKAFLMIAKLRPEIHFVLAGHIDKRCPPPKHEKIHYLGKLPHSKVSDFFCSLDVGIVYLRNTKYGQLSFPQKAYEMAACKIPMVVTRVGDMRLLFSDKRNELYEADNEHELVASVLKQLDQPNIPDLPFEDWKSQATILHNNYLKAATN